MMKHDAKRSLLYVVITFGMTWLYCLLVLYPTLRGESLNSVPSLAAQLLTMVVMFFPALSVLLTRVLTKEGFGDHWLKLNLRGNVKLYLLAWFAPGLLTLLGAALYFLIFPHQFDAGCTYLATALEASGAPVEELPIALNLLMVVQLLQGLVMAPILNFIACFGEEWGWRGYLLPKLSRRLPLIPTLLLSGLIWGLWHAPLTMVGHNYGIGYPGFPFAGIGMMCLFCTVLGTILSYVTLKSGSCIPAIIGHGAINGVAAIGVYFTPAGGDPFVGPAPTGIIGILPFALTAVLMVPALRKEAKA